MQKLVKKNIKNKSKKPFVPFGVKRTGKFPKTKISLKKNKPFAKNLKSDIKSKSKLFYERLKKTKVYRVNKRTIFNSVSGRPFRKYYIKQQIKPYRLDFRVAPNNVFCSLKDTSTNTTLHKVSGGSYDIKVTKKTSRHSSITIANSFLKDLRAKKISFLDKPLALKIIAPNTVKKPILNTFKNSCLKKMPIKDRFLVIDVPANKVFNGCRPCKQTRQKRQGLRLFK